MDLQLATHTSDPDVARERLAFCLRHLAAADTFSPGVDWDTEVVRGLTLEELIGVVVAAECARAARERIERYQSLIEEGYDPEGAERVAAEREAAERAAAECLRRADEDAAKYAALLGKGYSPKDAARIVARGGPPRPPRARGVRPRADLPSPRPAVSRRGAGSSHVAAPEA